MKSIIAGLLLCLLPLTARAADDRAALIATLEAERAKETHIRQEPLALELEAMLSYDTKLTLYSVKPEEEFDWRAHGKQNGVDIFRGRPVRGFCNISDKEEIRVLMHSLIASMRETNGMAMSCFIPHHGLTIEHAGKKIDLLICFGCLQGESFGAYSTNDFGVTQAPVTVFNKALVRHKLPLPE